MARRKQLKGTCTYCAREMTGGGLTRHFKSCKSRLSAINQANEGPGKKQTLYHLQVKSGAYWLHLEMCGSEKLDELDSYLRSIWLACCGHLSAFNIGPYSFTSSRGGWGNEKSMNIKVERIFSPKMKFEHEYDFGSTTLLKIQVVGERIGKPTTPHPIALMARNHAPEWERMECEEQGVYLCRECIYYGQGALCEAHSEEHECGEEMLMDLVNSPRTGVCGYSGPAEPPY